MLWIIILMFFSSSQAYLIHVYSKEPIENCGDHQQQCDPYLDSPCCDKNYTCKALVWTVPDIHACIKTVKLGIPCQSHLDCSGSHSMSCDFFKKVCTCTPNYIAINEHHCAPILNGYCERDSDCVVPNSVCNNFQCKCEPSYVSHGNDTCKSTPLGRNCNNNADCQSASNAICSDKGICECKPPYEEVNEAKCGSFLDGYCEHNGDCWAGNSECVNNKCRCKFTHVPISNENCQLSPLGKPCSDGDQVCNSMFYGLQITRKKYVCQIGRCTPLLGGFCIHKEDCASSKWYCINNVCTGEDGFVPKDY